MNPEDIDPAIAELESHWARFLVTLYPQYITAPFAPHHVSFWEWVWAITPLVRPRPFIGIWSRGHTKTTSAQLATIAVGARRTRRYAIYVQEAQDQADKSLDTLAAMLGSPAIEVFYPELADRALTKYGQQRGWRRNRLHTKSGFVIDSLGLDVASRGLKVEEMRPDWIIFDDIDSDADMPGVTERKYSTLSRRVLPLGSSHAAVIGIQNLIHADSIFSQLADGRADFLADRIVSGPIPAITDLTTTTVTEEDGRPRIVISGGTPTWPGMDIAACQDEMDTIGYTAFLSELQHETPDPTGGMYDHVTFRHCNPDEVPMLDKVVCWVDPAVTDKDESDSQAIQIDGIARDGMLYRLWSWEHRSSPQEALRLALSKAVEYGAIYVGIETDQGGDTWHSVFREARASLGETATHIQMRSAKAGSGHGGKAHRASQMLTDYERGLVIHVNGTHAALERALIRFPRSKPFDLADAAYWGWWDLRRLSRPSKAVSVARHRMPDSRPSSLRPTGTSGIAGRGRIRLVRPDPKPPTQP